MAMDAGFFPSSCPRRVLQNNRKNRNNRSYFVILGLNINLLKLQIRVFPCNINLIKKMKLLTMPKNFMPRVFNKKFTNLTTVAFNFEYFFLYLFLVF
jgi:hypothetical protein